VTHSQSGSALFDCVGEAMAGYSTAPMEEGLAGEGVAPQAASKSWRRFGMVAAALGSAGAVFGMTRPKSLTTLQKMQQVAHVGHSFMQAVVTRALQDDGDGIQIDMGMILAPTDLETFEGVSAEVFLRPAEEGVDPHASVTFQAKEEQGKDLADQFQKILDGAKEHFEKLYAQGFDNAHETMSEIDMFDVSQDVEDSDKVRITFTPPEQPNFGEEEENLEAGMAAKPTLTMMVQTGRNFQEMVDNIHGCIATLDGGINITASTKLAMALFEVMNDMVGGMGLRGRGYPHEMAAQMVQKMKALEAFSSVSSKSDIRYDTAKLEDAVCDAEESEEHKEQVEQMKAILPQMLAPQIGEQTVRAAAGLSEYADHLHSFRLAGVLPKGYEIYMEFENFHLTPVIAEFLQPQEESPEEGSPEEGQLEEGELEEGELEEGEIEDPPQDPIVENSPEGEPAEE